MGTAHPKTGTFDLLKPKILQRKSSHHKRELFSIPDKLHPVKISIQLFLPLNDCLLVIEAFVRHVLGQHHQADEVRDGHEAIGGIGEVPDEGEGHGGPDVGDEGEEDAVSHEDDSVGDKVLQGFLPVVFPAQDGGEGEEGQGNGDDVFAVFAEHGGESHDGEVCAGENLAGVRVDLTQAAGADDDQTGEHADDHGIEEGAGHVHVALLGGMIGLSGGGGNGGGAETGFVGEDAPGNAPAHGLEHTGHDSAAYAARHRLRGESHPEYLGEPGGNGGDVHHDDAQGGKEVEDGHGGHQDGGHLADGLNALYQHQQGKDGEEHSRHPGGESEGSFQGRGDGVGLSHVADAEGGNDGEDGEGRRQKRADSLVGEAVLHGVHGAAAHFADAVGFPIFYGQHRFGVFGGKAEGRGDPHPDQSAGASQDQGGADAHDVAGADGGGQGGHQGLEGGDVPFGLIPLLKNFADGVGQIAPGQEFQPDGQVHAGTHQKEKHDRPPDEAVDLAHKSFDFSHIKNLPNFSRR